MDKRTLIKTVFKLNRSNMQRTVKFMMTLKKPKTVDCVSTNPNDVVAGDPEYPARLKRSNEPVLAFHYTGDMSLLSDESKLVWWSNQANIDAMVNWWEKKRWIPMVKSSNTAIAALVSLKIPYVVIDSIYGEPRDDLNFGHFLWLTDIFGDYSESERRRAQERFALALCDTIVVPSDKTECRRLKRNQTVCRQGVCRVRIKKGGNNA